jgi:hypothetical protein
MRFLGIVLGMVVLAGAAPHLARAECSQCDGQYFCDGTTSSDRMCEMQPAITRTVVTCPNGAQWTLSGGLTGPIPTVQLGETVQPCTTATEYQYFCRYVASCAPPFDPGSGGGSGSNPTGGGQCIEDGFELPGPMCGGTSKES